MGFPRTTRLRYVIAKNQQTLQGFLDRLGVRVQVYGAPVWDGKFWTLWFVPNDDGADIKSMDLRKL